jgi:hypothetical protein
VTYSGILDLRSDASSLHQSSVTHGREPLATHPGISRFEPGKRLFFQGNNGVHRWLTPTLNDGGVMTRRSRDCAADTCPATSDCVVLRDSRSAFPTGREKSHVIRMGAWRWSGRTTWTSGGIRVIKRNPSATGDVAGGMTAPLPPDYRSGGAGVGPAQPATSGAARTGPAAERSRQGRMSSTGIGGSCWPSITTGTCWPGL